MGRYLTSEEVDQEYLNAMGPELGRFYGLLSNDCQPTPRYADGEGSSTSSSADGSDQIGW